MIIRCVLFALLLGAVLPVAAVSLPDPGVQADPRRATRQLPLATRHPVVVDSARFGGLAEGTRIALPSSDGARLSAATSRVIDHGDGRRSWIGTVSTPLGEQSAVLTFDRDGTVFGWLPQRSGLPLRLETRNGGAWLVEGAPAPGRLDDDVRLPVADGVVPKAAGGPVPTVSVPGLGDVPRVDVLVAYTPEMVQVWGSDDTVKTRIAFLEVLSNQIYIDSAAGVQIRVVGSERVDHDLPYGNDAILDVLSYTSDDPARAQVNTARFALGADLVVLVTSASSVRGSCGVAWLQGKPVFRPDRAIAVVNDHAQYGEDDCWEITFPHEVGHLMGSHHDDVTSGGEYGAYEYSRGHRGDVPGRRGFATVMAYPAPGQDYVALLSNPARDCLGQPCGIADFADNARSHTTAAATVAALVPAMTTVPDVGLSIADARVTEQHSGTQLLQFTVTRSGAGDTAVSFALQALPDSAAAGSDYVAPGRTRYTLAAGQASTTASVAIVGDRTPEKAETFSLVIVDPEGAIAIDGVATATIDDDDAGVYIDDARIVEGPAGIQEALLTVQVTQGAPGPVTLRVRSRDAGAGAGDYDAVAGRDFVALDRTLTIPAGAAGAQFALQVIGDTQVDSERTFAIVLEDVVNAAVLDAEATVTIADDDAGFLFYDSSIEVVEGTGGQTPVSITVRRYPTTGDPATIGYVIESDTGTAGVDTGPVQGSFVHSGAHTYGSFTINLAADAVPEGHERVRIRLVSDQYDVSAPPLVLTIADDDGGAPMLSIDDVETPEGTLHNVPYAHFTISTPVASANPISFDTVLVGETAGADDVWYLGGSHTLQPGQTRRQVSVQMQADDDVEPDETYRIELRNVVGAGIADGSGTGTIRDDDHGWPVADLYNAEVVEGAPGHTSLLRFQLQLDRPALAGTSGRVVIADEDGAATPGVDMAASVPFPAIAAGATTAWIEVPIHGDGDIEHDEGFRISLVDLVNLHVHSEWSLGTIRNDDHPWHEISEIQGRAAQSPFAGEYVSTQGVVTAIGDFGVVIQQENGGDGDPATSDAIGIGVNLDQRDDIAVGDRLLVGGYVHDPAVQGGSTGLSGVVQKVGSGRPLPAPMPLDGGTLHPASTHASLRHLEWMRVAVPGARVVGAGGLRWGEEWRTDYLDGSFDVVAAGMPRPRRDPGLAADAQTPLPVGVEPVRWDGSAETLRVDPYAHRGGGPRPVDAGDTFTEMAGVLYPHYEDGFRLALEPGIPAAESGALPTTAAPAAAGERGIAWLDAGELFDAIDDAGSDPVVPEADYALRVAKLARLGCGVLRHPEVLVVDGVENATVLADVAEALNDAATWQPGECDAAPGYVAVIAPQVIERVGSPQLGVLVRTDAVAAGVARVQAAAPVEIAADARFDEPYFDPFLFQRPPLVVGLVVNSATGSPLAMTLVAVSLTDDPGSDSMLMGNGWETEGTRVRNLRAGQALAVANWLQARQSAAPTENLVVMGDFQSLDGGDGLVDPLGIIRGGALPADRVVTWRASPVARPLVDVGARMHPADRWETVVDGTTAAYAHVLLAAPLAGDPGRVARGEYLRANADFAVDHATDPALPLHAAHRDPLLLRFTDLATRVADLSVGYDGGRLGGSRAAGRRLVVRIGNRGPSPALRPQLVLAVATPPEAIKVAPPQGWTCEEIAADGGARITCRSDRPLAVGSSPAFALDLAAAGGPGVTVSMQVSAATADPEPANNQARAVW